MKTLRQPRKSLREACLQVAEHFHGARGVWAYRTYEEINRKLFFGQLPWPYLTWGLTAHGSCLGYTRISEKAPVITLHPSVLGGTEKNNPWDFTPAWLGQRFAFDLLLHEMIHVSVAHRLGGWSGKGESSHNNEVWVDEVNRLAPLVGLEGVEAAMSKPKRVPVEGPLTKRGKKPTVVTRVCEGNVPFLAVATFPYGARIHLRTADSFYHGRAAIPLDV